MVHFQPALIQNIRASIGLVSLVKETLQLHKSGKQYFGLCPFHSEKSRSLHINETQFFCFGCHAKGDIFAWVRRTEGVSFPEAVRRLADRAGISMDPEAPQPSRMDLAARRRQQAMNEQLAADGELWWKWMRSAVEIARAEYALLGLQPWDPAAAQLAHFEYQLNHGGPAVAIGLFLKFRREKPEETKRIVDRSTQIQMKLEADLAKWFLGHGPCPLEFAW